MSSLSVTVLRAVDPDRIDCWGDSDAIQGVLDALAEVGIAAESRVVAKVADLQRCRGQRNVLGCFRELTVAVLGNDAARLAAPAEITLPDGIKLLDAQTKQHRIVPTLAPAPNNKGTHNAVTAALGVCRVLGIKDWARVDVVLERDGAPFVIDVNAMPGLRRAPNHPSYFPRCLNFALRTPRFAACSMTSSKSTLVSCRLR